MSSVQLESLFSAARTHSAWQDKPVSDAQLQAIYDLVQWGPTSGNCSPMRVVFVKSEAEKAKLIPCMHTGNQEKTRSAPVTAIIGMDMTFYDQLPRLFPHADARSWFVGNQAVIDATALRNSSLQGAYLMLAARALGLDCGPMSGFHADKVNQTFFAGTNYVTNFICNLGYGDASKLHPRLPRLSFAETCKIV
jgi:nitroreductase